MRVLIVDDDHMLCESLKFILNASGIDVVGVAHNGEEAFQFCGKHTVDIVLMDIRMPICDGVLGTKKIKDAYPEISIIMLTTFDDDHFITQAIKNGASAYLLKTVKPHKIVETLHFIYEGNMVLTAGVADKLKDMINANSKIDFTPYQLNITHQNIMQLIAEGLNNKEIAQNIHLSEGTIRNKISEILLELNLRDRTQIAIFWHTAGKMNFHN